jgi:hypothetical protein
VRAVVVAGVVVALVALLAVASAGCTPPAHPTNPVKLSIQLATRQSCGVLSGLDYDTSCAAAIDVRAIDPATRLPIPGAEQCTPVSDAAQLRDLLEGAPLATVARLSANRRVILQVRGLHDLDASGIDLCQDPNGDHAHWLFWGDSDAIDLSQFASGDAGTSLLRIVIDCRDCTFSSGCASPPCFGCSGLIADAGPDQCAADFPLSFCVPAVACDKACDSNADCFEGARGCVNHVCDTAQLTGTLCSPCGGTGAGCADKYQCVLRNGDPQGFCAPLCPDAVCATGTKCNRLHNALELAP